jgi:hypothetical protein
MILPLDRLIDFPAMDGNFAGGLDADADLVASNVHNRHHDLITDHDAFVPQSRKNKHRYFLDRYSFEKLNSSWQNKPGAW